MSTPHLRHNPGARFFRYRINHRCLPDNTRVRGGTQDIISKSAHDEEDQGEDDAHPEFGIIHKLGWGRAAGNRRDAQGMAKC
jgi:hypothetical protein